MVNQTTLEEFEQEIRAYSIEGICRVHETVRKEWVAVGAPPSGEYWDTILEMEYLWERLTKARRPDWAGLKVMLDSARLDHDLHSIDRKWFTAYVMRNRPVQEKTNEDAA